MTTTPISDPDFRAHIKSLLGQGTFPKRNAKNKLDFGDNDTVRLQLKRPFVNIGDNDIVNVDTAWGVFLGNDGKHWYVLPYRGISYTCSDTLEVFDSEAAMKERWVLD